MIELIQILILEGIIEEISSEESRDIPNHDLLIIDFNNDRPMMISVPKNWDKNEILPEGATLYQYKR